MYNVLFNIYGKIPSRSTDKSKFLNLLFSFLRFVIRKSQSINLRILAGREMHSLDGKQNSDIVVSLTSFPKRLDSLWMTIVSLKHQTMIPKKIVLYLINEEISKESLPFSLSREIDDIFEIRFRDGKLRAHGKYHFAMIEFPESCIITVDDDMIYAPDTIESLWRAHEQYPDFVITNDTHQILSENNIIKPYSEWRNYEKCNEIVNVPNLIPLGVCGALYPPHILYKDTFNFELVKKLTYLNDDLWLYAMTRLAGKQVVKSKFNSLRIMPIDIADNITLTSVNNGEGQNDVQFKNIRDYYIKECGVDIAK